MERTMEISSLRREFSEQLLSFVWSQWGQMGVLAASPSTDPWAVDPEALLLLTFEVAREDPRLFDEVLDWLLVNERLISLQRLRNLSIEEEDRALTGAVSAWLVQWRRKANLGEPPMDPEAEAKPLFLDERIPVFRPDPAFLSNGFLKSWTEPLRRSGHPDFAAPVNFAFRLRSLLGVGARAEVVRILLTTKAPAMSLQAIAASSGFTKRNVQEAANALRAAGVVSSWTLGNEQRFEAPVDRWLNMLGLQVMPEHRDWPQLFRALRVLLRWLREPGNEGLSDYMRASEGRALVEKVVEDLRFAGIPLSPDGPSGEEYWSHFATWVRELPRWLRQA
jgi:hypothetical protein